MLTVVGAEFASGAGSTTSPIHTFRRIGRGQSEHKQVSHIRVMVETGARRAKYSETQGGGGFFAVREQSHATIGVANFG